jgi:hypothetical protein
MPSFLDKEPENTQQATSHEQREASHEPRSTEFLDYEETFSTNDPLKEFTQEFNEPKQEFDTYEPIDNESDEEEAPQYDDEFFFDVSGDFVVDMAEMLQMGICNAIDKKAMQEGRKYNYEPDHKDKLIKLVSKTMQANGKSIPIWLQFVIGFGTPLGMGIFNAKTQAKQNKNS